MSYIELILVGLIIACYFYFFYHFIYADFCHFLHMFQLNSYFPERFRKWKQKNPFVFGKISFYGNILFFFIFLLVFLYSRKDFIIVSAIWFSLIGHTHRQNKEPVKKPLVYTARIKRMIAVYFVLYVVISVTVSGILQFWIDPLYSLLYAAFITGYLFSNGNYYLVYLLYYLLKPAESYLTNQFYQEAKNILKQQGDLVKIGITGSYGKTSTKFILENVLKTKYLTLVTPHSYNTTLGVVRTIREYFTGGLEMFVAEMGAKQSGDIKEICDLVEPAIGVITAVGPQHLETFKTVDTIIDTKFELARAVGKNGIVIVNGDDENIRTGMKKYPEVNYMTYGEREDSTVRILSIQVSEKGTTFQIGYQEATYSFQTRLLGKHNISNLAAGIALGLYLNIPVDKIILGIRDTKPVEHRLELKMQGSYYILDDAFNSNPVGANNALEVLKSFPNGKRFIMTPGMIELGEKDEEVHFSFGEHMASCADVVILVGEKKTEKIKEGLEKEKFPKENIFVVKNVFDGFAKSRELMKEGDVLLIENDLPDNY